MLSEKTILERTRRAFPDLFEAELSIAPVGEGASDRVYWRIQSTHPERTIVFMEYTDKRPDNEHFVPVSYFLEKNHIASPHVFSWVEDERLVWLEDLGSNELLGLRDKPWDELRPAYEAALREVSKIHAMTETRLAQLDPPELCPPFDTALYQWEHDYFFEQFAARFTGVNGSTRATLNPGLSALIEGFLSRPRSLVHRDFQSQNVLMRDGRAILIDYQGLRLGLPEYDVASLVFDPYVQLEDSQRSELLAYYHAHRKIDEPLEDWLKVVDACAAQRLMQALGAYGYIGKVVGKPGFFRHIPPAMKNLDSVLARSGLLPEVRAILEKVELPA